LRRFRHVVRHNYGLDLDPGRVEDNFRAVVELLPTFEADFDALETAMTREEQ
jgi:hypothetical protein